MLLLLLLLEMVEQSAQVAVDLGILAHPNWTAARRPWYRSRPGFSLFL
jgi:hypothetical protein